MEYRKSAHSVIRCAVIAALVVVSLPAWPVAADDDDLPPVPADQRRDPDDGADVDSPASRIHAAQKAREHTGSNKILIVDAPPGEVVSHFIVEGSDSTLWTDSGEPNGLLAGTLTATADGKPLEFFVPVSDTTEGEHVKVNNFFAWTEAGGWRLLDSVIATPSSGDTVL